jgi:predicted nucleic acid-binding protein
MKTYFVDSDAFIALIKEDDRNHAKAVNYLKSISKDTNFITSNYVFSEVITVLSLRVSKAAANRFIDALVSADNPYTIVQVTEEMDQQARKIFKAQTSKNVSFIDCSNIALIRVNDLSGIFSFDHAYKKNGLIVVPHEQ